MCKHAAKVGHPRQAEVAHRIAERRPRRHLCRPDSHTRATHASKALSATRPSCLQSREQEGNQRGASRSRRSPPYHALTVLDLMTRIRFMFSSSDSELAHTSLRVDVDLHSASAAACP